MSVHDSAHEPHDHDLGLSHDLPRLLERRGVLKLLVGFGAAPLVAGRLGAPGAAAAGLTGAGTVTDATCLSAVPEETAGPYPGDGSNGPNILTHSGVVRSDIRSSFGSSSTTAPGVPVTIRLTIQNLADGCSPLVGAAVYLWHCDRAGNYSMYSAGVTGENYLRGVQVTDSTGTVSFTSIFPGCYSGRWPHIHYEVYPSLAAATSSSNKIATSQIAIPQAACSTAYSASGYASSVTNLGQITLASDNVFRDGSTLQMATATGDNSSGWLIANAIAITATGITTTPATAVTVTPTTSPTTTSASSAFTPLAVPYRFLDTRNGVGASGKTSSGASVAVAVRGVGGVPTSTPTAAVFNLTATETSGWGYVTAWPEGAMPTASSLNVDAAGQTRANLVTVPIGADGSIRLQSSMSTHLLGDLIGYYSPAASATAGRFVALTPARLLDTRNGVGRSGRIDAGQSFSLGVAGSGAVPNSGVSAVVLNVTATGNTGSGYVTVWPGGTRPETSNLNLDAAAQTVANQVIVPLTSGAVELFSSVATHVIADVVGYYTDSSAGSSTSGLFQPVSPYRVLDTRSGTTPPAGRVTTLLVGANGTAAAGRAGAVMNVTLTDTDGADFLTVWPSGDRPTTSSVNSSTSGQTIAGHVTTGFGSDGGVRIYQDTAAHVVADVTGWFTP